MTDLLDLARRLRDLAEKAQAWGEDYLVAAYDHKGRPRPPAEETKWGYAHEGNYIEGDYIAAASPDTILALLDLIESQHAEIERLRATLRAGDDLIDSQHAELTRLRAVEEAARDVAVAAERVGEEGAVRSMYLTVMDLRTALGMHVPMEVFHVLARLDALRVENGGRR